MAVNVSVFHLVNILDTCSVWNILSSQCLYQAALNAKVVFACTAVVEYECLRKPRKSPMSEPDELLCKRLRAATMSKQIQIHSLEVEDLQTVEMLENRKRLGKGELSTIAFALKTRQAVLTDDKKARLLATEMHPVPSPQTTPHLFGWLLFNALLSDGDKHSVIAEHNHFKRPLAPYFEEIYFEACRCRCMAGQQGEI